MAVHLGIDLGAVGIKAALLLPQEASAPILDRSAQPEDLRWLTRGAEADSAVVVAAYRRTRGRPMEATRELVAELLDAVGLDNLASVALTGSGSVLVAEALNVPRCNEFQATVRAMDLLHPRVRTVFEIGGETSKYLRLEPDPGSGELGLVDYGTNGDCAAGTGAFLDQQASRLQYVVEDIGEIVAGASRAAQIAGRCSVFAKSDMIHAQQKGFTPPEVLRGLCNAVAMNYKSAVVKGHAPMAPIAFIGGVSANAAVVQGLRDAFELDDGELFVPEAAESMAAVGAAVIARDLARKDRAEMRSCVAGLGVASKPDRAAFPTSPPLSLDRVKLLRDRVRTYTFPDNGESVDAYLGLDIGSVGTKLVLIDGHGDVIHSIFTRTDGRPIEVVSRCMGEMEEAVGARVRIRAVGSTGSGRELIGELVGADSINDEITAHKTGATFVGDRLLGRRPDTIFEIGGQDSKYISLEAERQNAETPKRQNETTSQISPFSRDPQGSAPARQDAAIPNPQSAIRNRCGAANQWTPGSASGRRNVETSNGRAVGSTEPARVEPVSSATGTGPTRPGSDLIRYGSHESIVVDFTMNEACAAGTGSFLEERAEELGVSIKDEFAELALSSQAPIKLGERCTVFMERDVNIYMQRGAKREDVIAGLAYSIGYNYINRVVRGRRVGDCVFFQGGTAYNDAVAAAFSAITGKEIIVPPHNAVLGAIGAALLAKEKVTAAGIQTRFRGYDLGEVDYGLREFTCKGCGNTCSVQEFKVEGEKTFWGDKCSDRYRKRAKTDRKPVIPDLVALRHDLLHADDACLGPQSAIRNPQLRIGIPLAMYTHDSLPLWRRFFRDCGFDVVVSAETNKKIIRRGLDAVVSEPCFPIIVAHGHAVDLVDKGVDCIWLPNILSAETKFMDNESHVCPWGQTLPFVMRQAPAFRSWGGRILCPMVHPRRGIGHVRKVLVETAVDLGVRRRTAESAFEAGLAAQRRFCSAYEQAGRDALATLERTGESGMVIVGRPYNIHDAGVNLSVARKLRDYYGVNVLPVDALPVEDVNIRDVNDNMYWDYGRRILAAAKIVARYPNLHIIYITNFKCGPDSYIKGFVRPASGKPYLTLQFDGHSNDAGMMTRCEAYLDSKGILRWWRQQNDQPVERHSKDEPSTSPKWPTPVPG